MAIFFASLVRMIAGGMDPGQGLVLYPVVAPALIIVGCYMLRQVKRIDWDNFTEAFPAFLTILIMPMTFSITEGISFGFISYTLPKAVTGRFREVPRMLVVDQRVSSSRFHVSRVRNAGGASVLRFRFAYTTKTHKRQDCRPFGAMPYKQK